MESLAPSSSFDAAPPLEIDPNDSGRRGVSSLGSSKNSHSVTNNDVPQQQEQQRQPCSMPSWSMPRESANTNTNNLLLEPNPIDYSALWCVSNDVETSTPWRAPSPATLLQQLDFSFPAHQRQYGGSQVSQNSTLCDTSAAGALPSPPVLPRMHSGIIAGNSTDGKSNQSVLANFFSNSDNSCRNSLRDEQQQQQQQKEFPDWLQNSISNDSATEGSNMLLFTNNDNNINTDHVFLDEAEGSTNACSMGEYAGSSALLPSAVVSLPVSDPSGYAVSPLSRSSNDSTAKNVSAAAAFAKLYYDFLQQQLQQQQQQQQQQQHLLLQQLDNAQAIPLVSSTASITTCSSISSGNSISPTTEPLIDINKRRKDGKSNKLPSLKRTKKQNQHVDNKKSRTVSNTASKTAIGDDILPALSPYNFFFRDERERLLAQTLLLQNCTAAAVDELARASLPEGYYRSEEAKLCLLHKHWYRDRTVRRRHRKTHQQIGFSTYVSVKKWCG